MPIGVVLLSLSQTKTKKKIFFLFRKLILLFSFRRAIFLQRSGVMIGHSVDLQNMFIKVISIHVLCNTYVVLGFCKQSLKIYHCERDVLKYFYLFLIFNLVHIKIHLNTFIPEILFKNACKN